jgi:hypothetical protein
MTQITLSDQAARQMKRAALIAVIAVYGFLILRFVVTSRKSVNRVVESGVKTEGRKAASVMGKFPEVSRESAWRHGPQSCGPTHLSLAP